MLETRGKGSSNLLSWILHMEKKVFLDLRSMFKWAYEVFCRKNEEKRKKKNYLELYSKLLDLIEYFNGDQKFVKLRKFCHPIIKKKIQKN